MRIDDVRALHKELGSYGFANTLADLVEGRDQQGKQIPKLDPARVSLRMLWEALVGPVEDTLEMAGASKFGRFNYVEMQEAIDSSAFPMATGVLIAAKVIEAYENTPAIGDNLVTVMPSKLRSERVVGFTHLEGPQEVPENMPYAESSFGEKWVSTETAKKGRILEISEETVFFDQTGQIMVRAQSLGERTREEREETILSAVLDVGSGAVGYKDVYRPSGVATTLYSSTNTNLFQPGAALVDWTDLDEVMQYHAANVRDDRAEASERRPIVWQPKVLLVSRKKLATALRVLRTTTLRTGDITTGTGTQEESPSMVNAIAPGLTVMSSPRIDYLAGVSGSRHNDDDDWYIGDFKKQFYWQEIWPVQTFRDREDNEARFRRDVIARFKVRYFGGAFCTDTKYVVKVDVA